MNLVTLVLVLVNFTGSPAFAGRNGRNADSLDLTLQNLIAIHSQTLNDSELDSDLDWAYGRFELKNFIKNDERFKQVLNLLIKAKRFSGRDILFLSKIKTTQEEDRYYLSLLSTGDKFWYPAVSPASTAIAIEIFKINKGMSKSKPLLGIIQNRKIDDLKLLLSLPEYLFDQNVNRFVLSLLEDQRNGVALMFHHGPSGSSTKYARISEMAYNFLCNQYPGKFKPLNFLELPKNPLLKKQLSEAKGYFANQISTIKNQSQTD